MIDCANSVVVSTPRVRARLRQRGFTLIEVIIFIVVVAAGLAGILQVVNTTVAHTADPVVAKQALALADSILAEVMQKGYDPVITSPLTGQPTCGGAGTNRQTFDCVANYHGATKALFADWPAELADYNVAITVAAPAAMGGSTTTNVRRVTVTVSRGAAVSVTLVGHRANY
jgi:MSHA pilin protein MshD